MFKNCVFRASVNTKKWFKAASIRAIKTMAQTSVAMLPAASTINAVDWKVVIGTAALAGVTSILTSVAGIKEVEADEEVEDCEHEVEGK